MKFNLFKSPNVLSMPSYKGVSLDFLEDFNDRLFKGYEAIGVQLFVCTKESSAYSRKYSLRMEPGDTVQYKYEIDSDTWYGVIPSRNAQGSFDPHFVRPKVREEWTLQDVVDYVIKPAMQRSEAHSMPYVETMRASQVGSPFKGLFVAANANSTPLSCLVHSLSAYFDNVSTPEDVFIWIDAFCSVHEETHDQRCVDLIASKFSNRMFFVGESARAPSPTMKRAEGIVMDGVMIGSNRFRVCMQLDCIELFAAVMGHLLYFKAIVEMHRLVNGEDAVDDFELGFQAKDDFKGFDSFKSKKNGKEFMDLDYLDFGKKRNPGFRGSKAKSAFGTFGLGGQRSKSNTKPMKNKLAKKKFDVGGQMKTLSSIDKSDKFGKKGKGGAFSLGEEFDLGMEGIFNDRGMLSTLDTLLDRSQRPEMVADDLLDAIMNSNETL